MSTPTPGEIAQNEALRGVIPSDGVVGDAPLDEALEALRQATSDFADSADAGSVLEAANRLHERIQTRLEEARS